AQAGMGDPDGAAVRHLRGRNPVLQQAVRRSGRFHVPGSGDYLRLLSSEPAGDPAAATVLRPQGQPLRTTSEHALRPSPRAPLSRQVPVSRLRTLLGLSAAEARSLAAALPLVLGVRLAL